MAILKPKHGFDWGRIIWSPADGHILPFCSYCQGHIAEDDLPLTMWDEAGRMAHFCDPCMETWWGLRGE